MVGSTTTYLHEDHIGSIRFVSSSTGSQVFSSNYVPYGPQYGASGTPDEFLYAGKIYDSSTGFYYFGARYYDSIIGRFVTRDSSSGIAEDPQSLNRYAYARDNPLKITDPNGHDWWGSLTGAISNAANSLVSAVSNVASAVTNAVSSVPPVVQSTMNTVVSTVGSTLNSFVDASQRALQRASQAVQTTISQVGQTYSSLAQGSVASIPTQGIVRSVDLSLSGTRNTQYSASLQVEPAPKPPTLPEIPVIKEVLMSFSVYGKAYQDYTKGKLTLLDALQIGFETGALIVLPFAPPLSVIIMAGVGTSLEYPPIHESS